MSISSVSANASYQSPLQKLEAELQTEVSNGTISSSDQSALSSALTDIDSAIKASQSSDAPGTKLSPTDMQSKINDLIANEVSSGKLTSTQADELKGVFQATFAQGPGGPPSGDGASSSSATDASSLASSTTSSSDTSSTDTSNNIAELLQQFLQALQSSLSSSSSSAYNASGTSTATDNSSQLSAILIDYKT